MRYGNCFYCGKEISITDSKRMVPIEKPYINLFFHLDCYKTVPEMSVFLTQNAQMIYNTKYNKKKIEKKG